MSELQELICTKINHDIIGHVGAICNAVELLEEGDLDFIDDITNILKISSSSLAARLKFFRIAFGSNNASIEGIEDIIKNYINSVASKNYPIDTQIISISKDIIKPMLLLAMIIPEIIYKGGSILFENNCIKTTATTINQNKFDELRNINKAEQNAINAVYVYLQEILSKTNKALNITKEDNNNFIIEVL